jgi:nucleoside-diphosphate-sugar epimerase
VPALLYIQIFKMQISIVGLGWLGLPLARQLQNSGFKIVGTCQDENKQIRLISAGLDALSYSLGDPLNTASLKALFTSQLLILNIPPGGKQGHKQNYQRQMQELVAHAKSQGVKQCLFISTTAVYGDTPGAVTEETETHPNTTSGHAHVAIEQSVIQSFGQGACVLRLAGLVGGERHPAKHLAGRSDIANTKQVVNLVHRDDVISAIEAIVRQDKFGSVMHLCAHDHPSRKEYYQWAARKLGLIEPTFLDDDGNNTGKLINSHYTCQQLGLELKYPSPFDMLN